MNHTASFTPPALETLNDLLPAFVFTAVVASGDLKAVYVARQRSLDRDVAIKILSPEVGENPKFRQSFQVTARTMARLNHPNLIGVFDSGYVQGMLYFVMEFIPGKSLERSARGQCVELSQTLHLIEGISGGLAHAHAHGIVHGAVEPSVILLNQKAEPKIGNFGFSYSANATSYGENPYIAPEILDGTAEPDFRSDLYAVGAILYELLTGTHHSAGAPEPSSLSKCGPALDAIWRKATHPDPARRFAGMHVFHKEILDLIKGPVAKSSSKKAAAGSSIVPGRSQGLHAPPTTHVQRRAVHHDDTDKNLIRNLVIIVAILCVIYFVWGNYQSNAHKEIQTRELAAKQAAREEQAIKDAKKKADELKASQAANSTDTPSVRSGPVVVKTEDPRASLARLQAALAAGKRDIMPVGCVQNGESFYFLVKESMSWPEASWFAEQHGAHLAVPSMGADLQWLVANVTQKQVVWIGAARSGVSNWVLADGKPWNPTREPSGTGAYVGIDKDGFLRAASGKVRLPFVIQWHRDGKNPGSLDALLDVARESLGKSEPIFPPGTRTYDKRSFLFVARPIDWRGAVNLAEKSGGYLAVTATTGEIVAVEDMVNDFTAGRGIWLGASMKDQRWTWITGEPWKAAKWAKDAEIESPDTALIIQPGKSWFSRDVSEPASGFIIEWSQDAKSKPTISGKTSVATTVSGPADIEALSRKAKELISAADQKRTQQLGANSRKFASDLDVYIRNLPGSAKVTWQPEVENLKSCIVGSRIPPTILESGDINTNTNIEAVVKYGIRKQKEIDEEFLAYSTKIHAAFLAKVRESATQAQQAGQSLLAKSLNNTLEEAAKLEPWIQSLGGASKSDHSGAGFDSSEQRRNSDRDNKGSGENPPPLQSNDGGGGLIE